MYNIYVVLVKQMVFLAKSLHIFKPKAPNNRCVKKYI